MTLLLQAKITDTSLPFENCSWIAHIFQEFQRLSNYILHFQRGVAFNLFLIFVMRFLIYCENKTRGKYFT